jgi:hypothetical protein
MSGDTLWAVSWFVIALVFGGILTGILLTRPELGRTLLGLFWLPMAAINVTMGLTSAEGYRDMAKHSFIPGYESLYRSVLDFTNPEAFALLAAAFQVVTALLLLSRGPAIRVGAVMSIGYLVAVAGFGLPYMPNLFVAIPFALLLRRQIDRPIPATLPLRIETPRRRAHG